MAKQMDNYEDDILAIFNRRFTCSFMSEEYSDEDVFLYDCVDKIICRLHDEFGLSFDSISKVLSDFCSMH